MKPSSLFQNPTDEELIQKYYDGSDEACAILYKRYYQPLSAYLWCLRVSCADVSDLIQETFFRIIRSRSKYDPKKANFKNWIYRIALNVARNYFTKPRREVLEADLPVSDDEEETSVIDEIPDNRPDSLDQLGYEELKKFLSECLGKLPDTVRIIIWLKVFEQMTFLEIGKVVELKDADIKAKYFRALKQLRRCITERISHPMKACE